LSNVRLLYLFNRPDLHLGGVTSTSTEDVTQLSGTVTHFWSVGDRNRLFLFGSAGTSFKGSVLRPQPVHARRAAAPGRLSRGRAVWANTTTSAPRAICDSSGGCRISWAARSSPVAWLENGDAFDDAAQASWKSNATVSVIMDTLVGPVLFASSSGFDGGWKIYVGVGRLFR
jgi:hypothetical protein